MYGKYLLYYKTFRYLVFPYHRTYSADLSDDVLQIHVTGNGSGGGGLARPNRPLHRRNRRRFRGSSECPPPNEGGDDNAIAMPRSQREHEVIIEHRRSSSDACREK